jgi:hypothetical protein
MELTENFQKIVLKCVQDNGYYHYNGMQLHLSIEGEYVLVDYATGEYTPQWGSKAETYVKANRLHPAPKGVKDALMDAYRHSMSARRIHRDTLAGRYPHKGA